MSEYITEQMNEVKEKRKKEINKGRKKKHQRKKQSDEGRRERVS